MAQKIRALTSHNLIRSSKNLYVQKQIDLLDIGEKSTKTLTRDTFFHHLIEKNQHCFIENYFQKAY